MLCSDSGSGRAKALAGELGGEALPNREVAERSDLVILAHKPAQLAAVAAEVAGAAKVVVSILAGATQADVRAAYPDTPVFCVEPNTPAEVGRGVLAFAAPDAPVDAELYAAVRDRFARLGAVIEVPERLMRRRRRRDGRRARLLGADRGGLGRRRRAPRAARRDRADARASRAWPAPPSCCATTTATRSRCGARSPRRAARPPAAWRRSSAAACARRSRRRWTTWWATDGRPPGDRRLPLALIFVYTIIIVAWIVASFVFSLGARVPYNRCFSAVLDFLRDVSEPYLRIFRRLPLRFGPIDLSPIVAIFVLRIVGSIIVCLIAP